MGSAVRRLRAWAVELLAGFESQLYCSPAVQPRANYLTPLCFSVLIYDTNTVMTLTLEPCPDELIQAALLSLSLVVYTNLRSL